MQPDSWRFRAAPSRASGLSRAGQHKNSTARHSARQNGMQPMSKKIYNVLFLFILVVSLFALSGY